jgi:hypothetical protein
LLFFTTTLDFLFVFVQSPKPYQSAIVFDWVIPVVSKMETAFFIQMSTLPDYIKKGSFYQELQKSQSTGDDGDGSDGSFAGDDDFNAHIYDNSKKRSHCGSRVGAVRGALNGTTSTSTSASAVRPAATATFSSTTATTAISTATGVEEPYLSFPAQYCRFDVAAALTSTTSPRSKAAAVEVAVEPGSTAAAVAAAQTAASPLSAPTLPASVLGAVGVMSTLRYWGVEDELPLELVRYLLESEELS